jgi:hypothetical protein
LSASSRVPICANAPKRPKRTLTGRPTPVDAKSARHRDVGARDVLGDVVDLLLELAPEALEHRHPLLLAARNVVEFVFHRGRESVIDIALEIAGQEAAHDLAEVGRHEPPVDQLTVLLVEQRLDDARVGRRPADAVFFEGLYQARFRIARRWLGKMLRSVDGEQLDAVAVSSGGNMRFSSSSAATSSVLSRYAARNPANNRVEPFARKLLSAPAARSTATVS